MDSSQIDALCDEIGLHAAEDILCRALEDLGSRLIEIETLHASGPRETLHKALRGLAAVADQIGLSALSRVAGDVMICIEDNDPVAQTATLARLFRVGEASFAKVCHEKDLTI